MRRGLSVGWRLVLGGVYLLLFLPLVVIVALSFNDSRYGTLPFEPTLRWYQALAANDALVAATGRSLALSGGVALAAAVFGTALALWMVRHAGRWAVAANGALLSAVTVPWLILAVAMLGLFNAVGPGRSWTAMFLGSLVTSLPYLVLLVAARLGGLDPSLEHAARSLGASRWHATRRVVLPLLGPAILGGSLMAFTICFNNFVVQFFLAPFGVRTLPLEIYTLVRVGYQPDINALATVVLAATVVLIVVLHRLVGGIQHALAPSRASGATG